MFGRKEKQSLLESRTKALKRAEKEINELKQLKLQEERNNIKILEQNNKKTELINKIAYLANTNKCSNEKVILRKIKELVNDYQSMT